MRPEHSKAGAKKPLQSINVKEHVPSKAGAKKPPKSINVEEHVPTQEMQVWISNKNFALLNEDGHILLSPVGWLNTSLISAAQLVLREQHSATAGLQDPCLAQSMGFRAVSGEFVQIVHNGFGHWLTITNIGASSSAEVVVYDSLHPSILCKSRSLRC